jgi:hypothetical protein
LLMGWVLNHGVCSSDDLSSLLDMENVLLEKCDRNFLA